MTKPTLLSFSLCLLAIFNVSVAECTRRSCLRQQQNQCQLDRLFALDPDHRMQCEAGVIETWNHKRDQFRCAGVAVNRYVIEPNGLLLPAYSNAPQLVYIEQGRGVFGAVFPGCAETFQESQEYAGSSRRVQDQHQKIQHFRPGDVLAFPAGVASWCYNHGNERVIAVAVYDMANFANQLDQEPRNFYLAGNPDDEFQTSPRDPRMRRPGQFPQRPDSCNNIFCGMSAQLIAEAFNIDEGMATKLKSENDFRGSIVRVEGGLEALRPSRYPAETTESRCEEGRPGCEPYPGNGLKEAALPSGHNGIEETFCTMRLKENIADPSRADVYVPEVGRLSTVNSDNLPILRWLQMSASHVTLYRSNMRLPHWYMNCHNLVYVEEGQGRIQVVDENGNGVFDGNVRRGQILVVPQNFMVVKRAVSDRFRYVNFQTNDRAIATDLAGRTSAIRGMPAEVLANAFKVSLDDALRIKFGRDETTFGTCRAFERDVAFERSKPAS